MERDSSVGCPRCGCLSVYSNDITWVCKACDYKYPEGTRLKSYKPRDTKEPDTSKGRKYCEYLGYRGRLEDSYEQEAFDYEHEGYREMDF